MSSTYLPLRFLLVGGSTTAIHLGLTFVLHNWVGVHVTLASSIACITAMCYNYFMHYHWTFATDAPHGLVLVKYLLMCGGCVVLNGLVMHVGAVLLSLQYMLVQVIATICVVCLSISASSLWVFKKQSIRS